MPAPATCAVTFTIYDSDGAVSSGVVVTAELDAGNATVSGVLSNAPVTATTNGSGVCTINLVQGKEIVRGSRCYLIKAVDPSTNSAEPLFYYYGVIPNEASIDASELIPRNK